MNEKIASFLATAFKGLGGAGGFLAGKSLIDSGSIGTVDAAGSSLAMALATILGAVIAHQLGKFLAKYGPGFLGNGGSGKLPCLITTAVGFAMAGILLPSCSPQSVAAWGSAFDAKAVLTHVDENGNSASVVIRPKKITELKSARGKAPSLKLQIPKEEERVEALGFRIWNPLRDPLPKRPVLTPAEYAEVFHL